MTTKFIFITGGVVSSLGKGLAAASLGANLQARGYKVRLRKLDPYLNVDPGTMSPTQHGEVFVTDDGAETDLDLGHYERFTGVDAKIGDNVTTGKIYSTLIAKERKGDYLGGTVQVIPHVTDLIKEFILNDTDQHDFILCEIGGTVGDIEGQPFYEAIRQIRYELGRQRTMFLHLTLLPYISASKELKTKPTQHSVKELMSMGIEPDLLLCRTEKPVSAEELAKIALFCNLEGQRVIPALDVSNIYEAPISYHNAGLDRQVVEYFGIKDSTADLSMWHNIVNKIKSAKAEVNIAIVGKYVKLKDAYKSLSEALDHAGMANNVKVNLKWINSRSFMHEAVSTKLKNVHGILVPGGFGSEGVIGKIEAARFAREHKVPYLGICYGMQIAIIEAARNLLGFGENAGSTEFGKFKHPIIALMTEWQKSTGEKQIRSKLDDLGGTMRLGAYECHIKPNSKAAEIYGNLVIFERHRHRYEVNINYKEGLEKIGLVFSGMSPNGVLTEIIEYKNHPWFIGTQFHPELKSRPFSPHPLFSAFVKASIEYSNSIEQGIKYEQTS